MTESDRLNQQLHEGARLLQSEGASEVYVFGSAAHGRIHPSSDVDLAVSGLPPEKFFGMLSRLSAIFLRQVDLIDLDDENLFTRYLRRKGLLRRVV